MPRLPTIRVIGSHAISTSWPGSFFTCDGSGMMVVIRLLSSNYLGPGGIWMARGELSSAVSYQVRRAPVVSSLPLCRHLGSLSTVLPVMWRRLRMTEPYRPDAVVDSLPPGGSSMKGMNLSGKPGMVHPMQIPPTLGQPPMPAIQPRLGTLQLTTGPQQPIFTMHFGEPYSSAKSPCS